MDKQETLRGYTAEQWMKALLDMLDGSSSWSEIRYNTGLDEKRCKEIEKMYNDATQTKYIKSGSL
jgi:hypothetical protein